MSWRRRIHVNGGIYYVVQRSGSDQRMFSRPEDCALFEALLASRTRRTNSRVHAYCWTAQATHLILEIADVPLGRVIQGLTIAYVRALHRRAGGETGHMFRQRYRAAIIDSKVYLARLVRYVHYLPVLSGIAGTPDAAEHTSHHAYIDRSVAPAWLTTRATLNLIESLHHDPSYAIFMRRGPAPDEVAMFGQVDSNDLRVIGGPAFPQELSARPRRTRASLDGIIHTVTCRMGVDREEILSRSRRRDITLARALIAWYAYERRVATVSDVARCLKRDPLGLSMAIQRYRARYPELFKMTAIEDVTPIGPLSMRTSMPGFSDSTGERSDGSEGDGSR